MMTKVKTEKTKRGGFLFYSGIIVMVLAISIIIPSIMMVHSFWFAIYFVVIEKRGD